MPQWGHWLTALLEFKVSNAEKNTEVCDIMMSRHNIYVQAINYPTVARGEELLRIAPTPHHTPEMMKYFVGKIQISNSVFCLASFFFSTCFLLYRERFLYLSFTDVCSCFSLCPLQRDLFRHGRRWVWT